MKTVAAFDFDGTLTFKDTFTSFLFFTHGNFKALIYLGLLVPYFVRYLLGGLTRGEIKEYVVSKFYKGFSLSELESLGLEYSKKFFHSWLREEGLQRLKWHQSQGHFCVLISASLNVYLPPFAKTLGFDHCFCTQVEVDRNGKLTGKLLGENCWGPEKVRRLKELLKEEKTFIYAYGDSRGDKELLEFSDSPHFQKFPEGE